MLLSHSAALDGFPASSSCLDHLKYWLWVQLVGRAEKVTKLHTCKADAQMTLPDLCVRAAEGARQYHTSSLCVVCRTRLNTARSRVFAVLDRRGLRHTASLQSSSDCLPDPLYPLPPNTVHEYGRSGRHRVVVRTQDPRSPSATKAFININQAWLCFCICIA